MRYFLHLAYQGTNYSGWQRQSNATSIQQTIEESISKILNTNTFIHGCGRTDAGVHASQYFAHVDINHEIDFDFVKRINFVLPEDISVFELIPATEHHHAQYDAKTRTYTYHLHTKKLPQLAQISAYYNLDNINVELIHETLEIIKQTKDFRSLCKHPDLYKHTLCDIQSIDFIRTGNYQYGFEIKANRFLRGMIRYMVARLLDINNGKLDLNEFNTTLSNKEEFDFRFHKKAHPQGLYLSKVTYPYLERERI